MMKLKFDSGQTFQQEAIASIVDLFDGQPKEVDSLITRLRAERPAEFVADQLDVDFEADLAAVGNQLVLDRSTVLGNLQSVQDRNGIDVVSEMQGEGLEFDVEMETGTGKTYVYLRSAFELARRYSFRKFLIVVPSVAIREGVATSIRLMREHFRELYPDLPFDSLVYSGKSPEVTQSFATATSLQFMIVTIDSLKGDKNTRIMYQERDVMNGLRPVDFLQATRPVLILDEPQNMESDLSESALGDLNPMCVFRFSATHRKSRNVIYRLDPVDAHDLGLVKGIVVAEAQQQGADALPFIEVVDVMHKSGKFQAKLTLACRKKDGSLARATKTVNLKDRLDVKSDNPAYEGMNLDEISLDPRMVVITNVGPLSVGESTGSNSDAIYREMIRETIREHLRKEVQLAGQDIKVLSLFFIDKVVNFLGSGSNNTDANGLFVEWFDEIYAEELASARFSTLANGFPQAPSEIRKGYFAANRSKRGEEFIDSSGSTQKDDDAYDLIMKNKEQLLSSTEPVRFIFSHSALREGWDNPNVFQICTLRDMSSEIERRQTIGRGLRLPVNGQGERVAEKGIAQLTVIANESYTEFATKLQQDYKAAGVSLGYVRETEFSKLVKTTSTSGEKLGTLGSVEVWRHLLESGFLDDDGKVQPSFTPEARGFTLDLPPELEVHESDVIEAVAKCRLDKIIRNGKTRVTRRLNKQLYDSPDFQEFWDKISKRTTYRVALNRDKVIEDCVHEIKRAPVVPALRVEVTRIGMQITRGGPKAEELGSRQANLAGSYPLPDILNELQEATSLTRRTLVDILTQSGRLQEFIDNPNDFIHMSKKAISGVLARTVVEGIQYEEMAGSVYELRELQRDGLEERDRFLDQLYEVKHQEKTDFNYVLYDSEPEREFAQKLDSREDIRMFMKLPPKFKIPTPVGDYNPDWAIVKHDPDGEERIYMIRETKSTSDDYLLRPSELAKIECGRKHFAAIGISDFAKSTPENWNL